MLEALDIGFGRTQVQGWTSRETAWLIEASNATQVERMFALSANDAQRWVRTAELEVSPKVERRLVDHDVLVLLPPPSGPAFQDGPMPIDLIPALNDEPVTDLEEEPEEELAWVEVVVRSASGSPAANVAYELTLSDGQVLTGRTDADGMIRHHDLPSGGECEIRFPEVDGD